MVVVPEKYIATTRKHVAMHLAGPAKLLDRKNNILFRNITFTKSDKALKCHVLIPLLRLCNFTVAALRSRPRSKHIRLHWVPTILRRIVTASYSSCCDSRDLSLFEWNPSDWHEWFHRVFHTSLQLLEVYFSPKYFQYLQLLLPE